MLKLIARTFRSVLAQTCDPKLASICEPAIAAAKAGGTSFVGVQIDRSAKVELFASLELDGFADFITRLPIEATIIICLVEVMKGPRKSTTNNQEIKGFS